MITESPSRTYVVITEKFGGGLRPNVFTIPENVQNTNVDAVHYFATTLDLEGVIVLCMTVEDYCGVKIHEKQNAEREPAIELDDETRIKFNLFLLRFVSNEDLVILWRKSIYNPMNEDSEIGLPNLMAQKKCSEEMEKRGIEDAELDGDRETKIKWIIGKALKGKRNAD